MIPINISSSAGIASKALTEEGNIIGTASPREIVTLLVLIAAAYLIGLVIAYYLKIHFSHKLKKNHLDLITLVVKAIIFLIALGIAIPGLLDLSMTVMLLVTAGGLAIIGLSSQKVIGNFTCGLALLYERPFSTGDYISAGEVAGTVESIHLLSVLIRTTSGVFVWLPVANLFDSGVSNYYANAARRYEYDVGIRYQDDLDEAIRIITGILSTYTFVLKYPAPEVFVSSLGADSVIIRVRVWFPSVWANTKDDISLQTEVLSRVKAGLESGGIEIAFAQRVIWFANQPVSEHNNGAR